MPWVEPPVVRIEESDSLIDTVTIIPNTFHKNGCKGGCTPFINAKGVQFHYAFNGKKDIEKLSLDKKKIHINSEIYVGEISSNKLGLKIIDKNKLQRTFIDPNFDLPIIEIREECCVE